MIKRNLYGNCLKDFKLGEEIGYGASGRVYKAKSLAEGLLKNDVAIKLIHKNKCKNEIDIHKRVPGNSHFVEFYSSFEDDEYCYLVMELCTGGSLGEYLKRKKRLPEAEAANLIYQVLSGLALLHSRHIVHRDISLRNLLLTETENKILQVKIADFGLAVALQHKDEKINTVNQVGTANFMAPEVVNHDSYNYKADLWSVGCVLYALLYGSLPFNGKTKKDIVKNIRKCELNFPEYATREAKDFLKSLLNKNPEERIDYPRIIRHPLFQKYGLINQDNYQVGSGYSRMNFSSKSQLIHASSNSSDDYEPLKVKNNKPVKKGNFSGSYNNLSDNIRFTSQSHQVLSENHMSDHAPYNERNSREMKTYMDERNTYVKEIVYPLNTIRKNPYQKENENNDTMISYQKNYGDSGMSSLFKSHSTYASSYVSNQQRSLNINGSNDNSSLNTKFDYQPKISQKQRFDHAQHQNRQIKETKIDMDVKNTVVKSLKDRIDPLNTIRLSPERKEIEKENLVISILSDGKVCLECLKPKKDKKYVNIFYLISDDGLKINVYKPKKKILLNPDQPPPFSHKKNEVQYFTFENLPKQEGEFCHWRNYNFAKRYIDSFRALTPKVTVYGKRAACKMMENTPNPNYKMLFYDYKYNGFEIVEKNRQLTVKDEKGCLVTESDCNTSMLEEFEHMKQRCKEIEKYIETYQESDFPAEIGKSNFRKRNSLKKPDVSKKTVILDNNKENSPPPPLQSHSVNRLNTDVPLHIITINNESSFTPNTFQRSTPASYLGVKNTNIPNTNSSRNITSIIPNLKSLKVVHGWIIADYKDGIQMNLSRESDEVFFKDTNSQQYLSERQYPELKVRFENDSRHILRSAMQMVEDNS